MAKAVPVLSELDSAKQRLLKVDSLQSSVLRMTTTVATHVYIYAFALQAAEGHHVEGGAGSEGSHQEREMDVSSGSEQEVTVTKRKKHLTEEEMEAALAAKGANKAREWLESGFAFKKVGLRRHTEKPHVAGHVDASKLLSALNKVRLASS